MFSYSVNHFWYYFKSSWHFAPTPKPAVLLSPQLFVRPSRTSCWHYFRWFRALRDLVFAPFTSCAFLLLSTDAFSMETSGQEESRSLGKTVQEGVTRAGKLDACLSLAKDFGYSAKERDLDKWVRSTTSMFLVVYSEAKTLCQVACKFLCEGRLALPPCASLCAGDGCDDGWFYAWFFTKKGYRSILCFVRSHFPCQGLGYFFSFLCYFNFPFFDVRTVLQK